jgi:hypothetical protein
MTKDDDEWVSEDFDVEAWMTLAEAADYLLPKIMILSSAQMAISELISAGRLELRAQRIILEENDQGEIRWHAHKRNRFSSKPSGDPMLLRRTIFAQSTGWNLDADRCVWQLGILVAFKDVVIRRAAKGVFLRKSDLDALYFKNVVAPIASAAPLELSARIRPDLTRAKQEREAYCLPGQTEIVMAMFRTDIASGNFAKCYPDPYVRGVRAEIGREFERRMLKHNLAVPSPPTLKRRVNRLADEFTRQRPRS